MSKKYHNLGLFSDLCQKNTTIWDYFGDLCQKNTTIWDYLVIYVKKIPYFGII